MISRRILVALCLSALALPAHGAASGWTAAGPGPAADEAKPADKKAPDEKPPKEEKPVVTKHTVTMAGKPVSYTATSGYMAMKDEAGKLKANIFFVAYTKDGGGSRRPVTFTFNGGPGSSSVWLHLGAHRPQARRHGRQRRAAAAALPSHRQRVLLAGVHRPRLHRSGHDRLQPAGPRREARAVPRRAGGPRVRRRVHPPLHHEVHAVGLAQVPGRRELRDDARRGPLRLPAGPLRHVLERHRPHLHDPQLPDGRLQRRQRPAVRHVPAELHGHGLVPQAPPGGPAVGPAHESHGRVGEVRDRPSTPSL